MGQCPESEVRGQSLSDSGFVLRASPLISAPIHLKLVGAHPSGNAVALHGASGSRPAE